VGLLLYTKLLVDYDSEAAATGFLACMLLAMVVLPLEVYEQVTPPSSHPVPSYPTPSHLNPIPSRPT
jgi:hypothetical protein